jgi:gliding motility-associated-like protein
MKLYRKHLCIFSIACCLLYANLHAQDCDSNYFSFSYSSSDFVNYIKTLVTPDNLMLGLESNKYYQHGLTKFTAQGDVVFSYLYSAPFNANGNHAWTDLFFTDMAVASESAYLLTGSVTKRGVFSDNTEIPAPRTAAVLIKIDKYGKVIWSRFFASQNTDPLAFSNVIALSNGDVVAYLTTQRDLPYYGKVICFSSDGDIKWVTILNTGDFSSGDLAPSTKRSLIQTKNGNIVIGDIVFKIDSLNTNAQYHFLSLNSTNGALDWETSYEYFSNPFQFQDIVGAVELPNGDLSFQTSLNDPASPIQKQLNIITDSKGNIKKMTGTYPSGDPASHIIDAKQDSSSGNQAILMLTSDQKSILMQIDKDGSLNWSRKYGKSDNIPPACFSKINNAYDIVLSNFSRNFGMLRTDPIGNLDCDTINLNMIQETIPMFGGDANNIHTKNLPPPNDVPYSTGFFVVQNTSITSIQRNTVCQKNIPCCIDVVDTTHINSVSLCEGGSYKLPDNTIVRDSGRYYVSYKTLKGCDSISLYEISVDKNPATLSLGLDTCFTESDSLILHATDGYSSYVWDDLTTPSSNYTVHKAGVYSVTVSNVCGSKTDSIHVYEQCDFPIYMPNAFTPNGDRLNDLFKVPSLNLNRLLQFTIYNRWGKIVFQTKDINKGWDGTINNIPQQQGSYVYYLQMESIVGKKINQKGTLTLMR